jgi:hypothetical protein
MDQNALDQFYEFLTGTKDIYSDMLPVLKDEIQCIHNDNIAGLDEALKIQQALILKTRSFDERVKVFLEKLGLSTNTLTETIRLFPKEEQFRFYSFLGEFDGIVEQIAFYRDKCRELLQTKLYRIESQIERSGLTQAMSYNVHAGEVNSSPYMKVFEKMI